MAFNWTKAQIGQLAPLLAVSDWVKGQPSNLDQLTGRVVLVEVFQVNCPGCFLYSLPQAIELHQRYAAQGLTILAVATAFEDFDKNTLQNLTKLIETGQLIGETLRVLKTQGQTENDRWQLRLPFPVGMDQLIKNEQPVSDQTLERFILEKAPHFSQQSTAYQQQIKKQIMHYLQALEFQAVTFERYGLQGTPSQILIDKRGILRASQFGAFPNLENQIQALLVEPD